MNTQLTVMLNSAADAWAAWMWPMAWHVTVLVLLVAVLTWLLRGRSARLRYALWLLVPIRLLVPPTLALATGWGWWLLPATNVTDVPASMSMEQALPIEPVASRGGPAAEQWQPISIEQETFDRAERMGTESRQPAATVAISLRAWLFCGWLLGVGVLALRLLYGCLCAATMVRGAQVVSFAHSNRQQEAAKGNGASTGDLLESCRGRVGIQRPVRLCQLVDAGVPMLIGFVRPTIILPTGLDKQLTSQELEAVLVHELQHVARYDAIVHLGQSLLGVIYFFHPLVWLTNRMLNRLREDACDEATVAALEGQRRDYGAGIVKVAKLMSGPTPSMSLGIVESGGQVKRRLGRILDPRFPIGRSLSWSTFALLLLLAAIVLPVAARPGDSIGADTNEFTGNKRTAAAGPVDDDLITIPGRVLDPAGKPVAGATVRLVRWYWDPGVDPKPLAETRSDKAGHFKITYRKSKLDIDIRRQENWKFITVAAFKAGYGPAWIKWQEIPQGRQAELRLAEDGLPITGRLIDLEGRPLAGVNIECEMLTMPIGADLSPWIEAVKGGKSRQTADTHFVFPVPMEGAGLAPQIISDADGRFRLSGIGRERMTRLVFSGPGVACTSATVLTRAMPPLSINRSNLRASDAKESVLGADFELPLPPTRVIEGIVRDAKTGQPIAGAGVRSSKFSGTNTVSERLLRTKSDDKGHFRLVGLLKGPANKIIVVPGDEQPYLMREATVPDTPGLEPAHVDVELHRGVVITGRVTDALTGEAVPTARLLYLPFLSNEYARALPEFEGGHAHPGYNSRYQTAADGSYRLVGLPGRAIVGVVEPGSKVHVQGRGASEIEGMDSKGEFLTVRNPLPARKDWPTAMKEINPADESQSVELDFALDSGEQVEITTVDPAGQPISGVMVTGMRSDRSRQPASAPSFVATFFGPTEERTILLNHEKRSLGKVVRVRAAGEMKKITVRLEPCAKIVGRLVDHSSQVPVAGAEIRFEVLPHEEFPPQLESIVTDANGRFEQPAVLPGANYTIIAVHPSIGSEFRRVARGLAVSPGETIDLGTIDVTSDKRPEPVRTKAAGGAEASAVRNGSITN